MKEDVTQIIVGVIIIGSWVLLVEWIFSERRERYFERKNKALKNERR